MARQSGRGAAATTAGETINGAGRTASVISIHPGASIAVWLAGPADVPHILLDLGFTLVPDTTTLTPTGSINLVHIGIEELDILTGDDVLMLQSTAIEGESESIEHVTSTGVWQVIPTVATGRVATVDRFGHLIIPGLLTLIAELFVTRARKRQTVPIHAQTETAPVFAGAVSHVDPLTP